MDGLRIRAVPRAGKEAYAWKRKERGPDDGSRKNDGICPSLPVAFAGNQENSENRNSGSVNQYGIFYFSNLNLTDTCSGTWRGPCGMGRDQPA